MLAELPFSELDLLRPHLQRVRLVRDQELIESGQTLTHVFFIESGIVALLARTDRKYPSVQVAMIGQEGMIGGLGLLDDTSPAYASAVVQVPGGAQQIRLPRLWQYLDEKPAVCQVMLQYVQSLARLTMETATRNARETAAERCVNWLIMIYEWLDIADVPVTQEALSNLLGVRRSCITLGTAALEESGLMHTSCGRIRILDRADLMAHAAGSDSQSTIQTPSWPPITVGLRPA